MSMVEEGHLGGYVAADATHRWGDDWTYTPGVWQFLLSKIKPATVLDVGCGEGHATKWFMNQGCEAWGLDGSQTAFAHAVIPKDRFILHDLQRPWRGNVQPELIWACEFVEHVDKEFVGNILDVFNRSTDAVAMTHAFPGQGGHHHVNCQQPEYWIDLMSKQGFEVDWEITKESRLYAPTSHWERSGLVFRRPKAMEAR